MSLKVMNGARTLDSANLVTDIAYQTLTVGGTAQVNSTGVDMSGHAEFLACCMGMAVHANATLTWYIQESDEAAANFVNISGATKVMAASSANDAAWIDVNWKHPDRLKYGRIVAIATGANTATVAATSLRVQQINGDVTADASFVEVK